MVSIVLKSKIFRKYNSITHRFYPPKILEVTAKYITSLLCWYQFLSLFPTTRVIKGAWNWPADRYLYTHIVRDTLLSPQVPTILLTKTRKLKFSTENVTLAF